jgi:ubiquinone biosynthesis protein COQ9
MALPPDPTLDEIRAALATAIAANAAFDGWNDAALVLAAQAEGVDIDVARLAFPGGAIDMIDAWFADIDAAIAVASAARISSSVGSGGSAMDLI